MTEITTEPTAAPHSLFDVQHEHTSRCYWDLYECRWQCAAADAEIPKTASTRAAGLNWGRLPPG